MEILEQTRTRLHHRFVQQSLPNHQVKRASVFLEQAKSIGLLFDASLLKDRTLVLQFADRLKREGKQVQLLGFFNEKRTSSDYPFKHFDKKQLDWVWRPKSEVSTTFSNQSFDLLINLSKQTVLPLDFIAAHSKARFRVGPATAQTFCYDLMIEHDERKGLDTFLKQVLQYVGKMQPARHSAVI